MAQSHTSISDEQVEAGARALFEFDYGKAPHAVTSWDRWPDRSIPRDPPRSRDDLSRRGYRLRARAVLEAAGS